MPSAPLLLCIILVGKLVGAAQPTETIDFNRDVRPILSEKCFHCHGQDAAERKAKLRLDTPAGAFAKREDGAAIVPGDPSASVMLARMMTTDQDDLMPPPDSHRVVTPAQIDVVRRWILAGAPYANHWAFVAPQAPSVKNSVQKTDWSRTSIDSFIEAGLRAQQLTPSPEVSAEQWQRRVHLDVLGLPVSPPQRDQFLQDVAGRGEAAYGAEVERLFTSPRYGERMAQTWMDVARYADSHGFNNDSTRSMWRWRDWVIEAFQANMPYDQFLTKQLAGDLLPQATDDDRIATGFNRNHVINSEGGIIDEEYRVEYVADRVRTLGMAFMGLTLECARCHDHKYDPISQRDYYQLFACFNNVDEVGEDGRVANARPLWPSPTRPQRLQLSALEKALGEESAAMERLIANDTTWEWSALSNVAQVVAMPDKAAVILAKRNKLLVNAESPNDVIKTDATVTLTADVAMGTIINAGTQGFELPTKSIDLNKSWSYVSYLRWEGGVGTVWSSMNWRTSPAGGGYGNGNELRVTAEGKLEFRRAQRWPGYAIQVVTHQALTPGLWHHVAVSWDGSRHAAGVRMVIDGQEKSLSVLHDDTLNQPGGTVRMGARSANEAEPLHGELADVRWYADAIDVRTLAQVSDAAVVRLLHHQPDPRRKGWVQARVLREKSAEFAAHAVRYQALNAERAALHREVPTTMVMQEMAVPRQSHVLVRGQYDKFGAEVTPDVPSALGLPWPSAAPRNRLGLAQWLTDQKHPMTARVAVNRLWQQLFGVGLVQTPEDFGVQGTYPTHPALLDHLSTSFIQSGWDIQAILRLIVLSSTYRQTASVTPIIIERDPQRLWLSAYPRRRLAAELIRDQALALSGLLTTRIGGPSVFPYQPEELYVNVVVDAPLPGTKWHQSHGDDLYRRSLYTYWKRTVPHPMMSGFDVPDREACTTRRSITTTPLQALILLNEPGFVEAARAFGQRMAIAGGDTDQARVNFGFRATTGRAPTTKETDIILQTLTRARVTYAADPAAAAGLLGVGEAAISTALSPLEVAAWATVGSLLLNLDATIHHQ